MKGKAVLLGEEKKEGIAKGTPRLVGACIWCDEPVWISSIGYFSDEPGKDVQLPVGVIGKPLHKLCIVDLMAVGKEIFIAMGMNLKKRGHDIDLKDL